MLRSFGQGSLAHQTAEGGTGLGLPITKGLTELHDSTFELKSELGYGTEVIISFPRSRVVEALPRLNERGEEEPKEPQVPWRPSKDHPVSKTPPPRHLLCPSVLPT